jgi:hypothetical protein
VSAPYLSNQLKVCRVQPRATRRVQPRATRILALSPPAAAAPPTPPRLSVWINSSSSLRKAATGRVNGDQRICANGTVCLLGMRFQSRIRAHQINNEGHSRVRLCCDGNEERTNGLRGWSNRPIMEHAICFNDEKMARPGDARSRGVCLFLFFVVESAPRCSKSLVS